jgi:hypothetical protein
MAKDYKVECLRNVGIEGKSFARGEVAEVDESTAGILVGIGKARVVSGPKSNVQSGASLGRRRGEQAAAAA